MNTRGNASRLASEVFTKDALMVLPSLDYTVKAISEACLPLLEIEWNRRIPTSLGGRRLGNFMERVSISRSPNDIYNQILSATQFSDCDESQIIPSKLDEWRGVIVRFGSNAEIQCQDWVAAVHFIGNHLVSTPRELSALSKVDINNIFGGDAHLPSIIQLWQGSSIALQPNRSSSLFKVNLSVIDGILARTLRRKDIYKSRYAIKRNELKDKLDFPSDFDKAGPSAKIKMLSISDSSDNKRVSFLDSKVALSLVR